MKRKILVFHPDINVHKSFSYYTKSVYDILSENYEVKSFEWSLTHLFNKNIEVLFLFWFENLIGNPNNIFMQRIQYAIKLGYLKAMKKRGIRIVYGLHNKAPHNLDTTNTSVVRQYEKFMRNAIDLSDSIIVANTKTVDNFKHEYGIDMHAKKVTHVPLATTKPQMIDRQEYRKKYNVASDEFFVGCIGKVERYKNVDLAISAFLKSGISGKFIVAGGVDAEYELELRHLAADNPNIIYDFHFLEEEEMLGLIHSLDLVVLPYEKTSSNSGILIDAFLNDTNILAYKFEMLYDYSDDCFYSYDYTDREDHLSKLTNALKDIEKEYKYDRESFDVKRHRLKVEAEGMNTWDNVKRMLSVAIQ